jgi:hypothetical protein
MKEEQLEGFGDPTGVFISKEELVELLKVKRTWVNYHSRFGRRSPKSLPTSGRKIWHLSKRRIHLLQRCELSMDEKEEVRTVEVIWNEERSYRIEGIFQSFEIGDSFLYLSYMEDTSKVRHFIIIPLKDLLYFRTSLRE